MQDFQTLSISLLAFYFILFFFSQLDFTVETWCKNCEAREQIAFYGDLNYILHLKNQSEQRVEGPGALSVPQSCCWQPAQGSAGWGREREKEREKEHHGGVAASSSEALHSSH